MMRKHLRPLIVAAAALGVTLGAQAMPVGGEADPFVDQQGQPHEAPMPLAPALLGGPWELQGDVVSPEQESQWRGPSVAQRDDVRGDYFELLGSGALNRPGEIAEPREVLAARAQLNEEMAETLQLALLAEQVAQAEQTALATLEPWPYGFADMDPALGTSSQE